MKVKYCCRTQDLNDYYTRQAVGHGITPFIGSRYQRGAGFGDFFRSIGKKVMPFITQGAKTVGKELLRGGLNLASDVMEGKKNLRDAFKERSAETLGTLREKGASTLRKIAQEGGSSRIKRRKKDIFD